MEAREDLSPDIVMGYCERDEEWYEWDKVWEKGFCPTCGGKPSTRHNYQITTSRTFNPSLKRPKIKR